MLTKADFCSNSKTGPRGYAQCPHNCSASCYFAIEKFQDYLKRQQHSRKRTVVKNVTVKKFGKKRRY